MSRREPKFHPQGTSRAPRDALDGSGDRLSRGDRERQQLRAVGDGGIDGALATVGGQREVSVHACDAEEGTDEGTDDERDDRRAQRGGRAGCEDEASADESGDCGGGLTQAEHGHLGGCPGQNEAAGDGIAGGSQGVQGRGSHAPEPSGDLGCGVLLDAPLGDAGGEGEVARGQGSHDEGDAADGEACDDDIEGEQDPGTHDVPPRFRGSVLRRPIAFMRR